MIIYVIVACWLSCPSKVIDSSATFYTEDEFCHAWSAIAQRPDNGFGNDVNGFEINFASGTVRRVECSVTTVKNLHEVKP